MRLRHSRIHAADCAECETKAGRLDRVEWTVQFSGTLTGNNGPDCWRSPRCVLCIAHYVQRFTFPRRHSLTTSQAAFNHETKCARHRRRWWSRRARQQPGPRRRSGRGS